MTITVSITEYRNRTDEILDAVIEEQETVVVRSPTAATSSWFRPSNRGAGQDRLPRFNRRQPCCPVANPQGRSGPCVEVEL